MDAITLLTTDHRKVEGLFKDYEAATDPRTKKDLVDQMSKELSIHSAIEEEGFYPKVKDKISDGQHLIDESLHEHQQVKDVLAELERMQASDAGYDAKVHSLIADVKHHVQEEETELFPKVRAACDAASLTEMGEKLEQAKGHAPTHPHPMAPNQGAAAAAAGMMAGAMDRARDAMGGRKDEQEVREEVREEQRRPI